MSSGYDEEDYLMLSGIQHMAFCERQWALIHIEQVWAENVSTLEGRHLHERADDRFEDETRNDIRVVRAMPLVSQSLGLRGVADVVEFHKVDGAQGNTAVQLPHKKGWWRPYPVEYKRGRPKADDRDAVQLCAQAIALEEMFSLSIESGFLFYCQTRRRQPVSFDEPLRSRVHDLVIKMHQLMAEGKTPRAQKGKHCSLCSLREMCQPNLTIQHRSVKEYLARMVDPEVKDS